MKPHLPRFLILVALAGLVTMRTGATPPATWNNASGNSLWDLTSTNWSSLLWSDGSDAWFGATGAGVVTLGAPVSVHNQTFTSPGYTIAGGANALTLLGSNATITVTADFATNSASLVGTDGLIVQGPGTLVLTGDPAALDGNHYTGGTYVHSGTLILAAPNANTAGTAYAVDSIEALDAGATVKFGTLFNGTSYVSPALHQVGSHAAGSHLRMTGGTFDLNNEPRNQHLPIPDGTGLIVNTGTNVQSGLILYADGQNHEFSGVIADGGPLVGDNNANGPTPQGPGRQIGIVNIAAGLNGGEWTLSGSNTYSGSTRLQFGSVKLAGSGTIGFPTPNGMTGPLRIYGPSHLDLNGRNQTIALMQSGDANGKIYNSAVGTVSTLTFGYGNEQAARNASMQYIDNPGVGGVLALKKIGTNCSQTLSGVNTYSGDTTVAEGTLAFATTTAVSPNTTFRLNTTAASNAVLALNYSGDAPVKGLYINGTQMPPGTYGAGTAPITGSGTITVTSPKTWNNGSGNSLWDLTSTNWSSLVWSDGDDANFGATGAGTVTLGEPVSVRNQTFNSDGYSIEGATYPLTLIGTAPTITVNASSTNATSLNGTNGLMVQGSGTLTLKGDPAALTANNYTGGTFVRSGTLVLSAPYANNSGLTYAVDSIEAIDPGATVKFDPPFDGANYLTYPHQVASHNTALGSRLHLTGGTFDLNNDFRAQHLPIPEGSGLIINTGDKVQSGLILVADGKDHAFSGVIADGGPLVGDNTGQGPGRQIGIVNIAAAINGGGGEWTLSGSNTYSGSTRLQFGSVKLAGNGTIGFPTANGLTGPLRIYGPSHLDLNGCNQTLALMTGGDANGKIYNSAAGTVSTLTFGYGNETSTSRNANMQYFDNTGVGGILAMKKIGNACIQTLSGVNSYSGDTTVAEGTLAFNTVSAVSSNSAFRLASTAVLRLNYSGTANVRQLWIDGVQKSNGVYGAGTPGIDATSTGTLTVTGFAPATLTASQSGGQLTFSWQGVYRLQAKTNDIAGPWFNYPGGASSPVNVPLDHSKGSVYFRLATY